MSKKKNSMMATIKERRQKSISKNLNPSLQASTHSLNPNHDVPAFSKTTKNQELSVGKHEKNPSWHN